MYRGLPVVNRILNYHKHIHNDDILENNLKNMKPVLSISPPCKPTFLVSRKK